MVTEARQSRPLPISVNALTMHRQYLVSTLNQATYLRFYTPKRRAAHGRPHWQRHHEKRRRTKTVQRARPPRPLSLEFHQDIKICPFRIGTPLYQPPITCLLFFFNTATVTLATHHQLVVPTAVRDSSLPIEHHDLVGPHHGR